MDKIEYEINHDLTKAKDKLKTLEEEKMKLLGEIKAYEKCLSIIEDYKHEED